MYVTNLGITIIRQAARTNIKPPASITFIALRSTQEFYHAGLWHNGQALYQHPVDEPSCDCLCYNPCLVDIELQYQQTLDYLYSFVDYSLTRTSRWSADKFDLSRMTALLELLGHPERDYSVIHIAGTKGKGSVSAFCASVLKAAGYRTGLYTSPHLHDYTERIRVGGEPISKGEMVHLVDEIRPWIESIKELTTFEVTTALAFLYFKRQEVKAAVI